MRLVARLRRQDWMAAIIELVIVVVGILLARQISNWNQNRIDRAQRRLLPPAARGLGPDRTTMDEALAFWDKVSAYGRGAIANGEQGTLVNDSQWQTLLAWYQASQLFPFGLKDTTFTEIRDTSDLALIIDEKLRKRVADYYHMTDKGMRANILRHDPIYRMEIRGLTPWPVQE